MLAGVDYILMGAGIPKAIPGILDRLSKGLDVEMRIDVKGTTEKGDPFVRFSPAAIAKQVVGALPRPKFLAIVSSHVLAKMLATKSSGEVDGFVVELPVAGGHNAPPRARGEFNEIGEPVYGDRDVPDLEAIKQLGKPFWMAGGYAEPEQVAAALELGAAGVQVGTAFAYCNESGFTREVKDTVIERSREGVLDVYTDAVASPTGFPFKVLGVEGSLSDRDVYAARERVCDLGYLRTAHVNESGRLDWRCPAEPLDDFVRKGGDPADAAGRKCLCNALLANVGLAQLRNGAAELPLITSGDDVAEVARFLPDGADDYSAVHVVESLLGGITA
jgi:nitronate monooxygenase